MAWKYQFTVFTPTYNRAHTLPRLHESLKRQTFRDFEWLIIDDGSTDNTSELVKTWQEQSGFPIKYHWQENAHKKGAMNSGVAAAEGELFLTIDSDDELLDGALEIFIGHWLAIPEEHRRMFSAVTGLLKYEDGDIVGASFPCGVTDCSPQEMFYKYNAHGDKCGFQRTDVMREYPFPQDINGHVPESVVWFAIGQKYLTRFVNDIVGVCHISPASITQDGRRIGASAKHAEGHALSARDIICNDFGWFTCRPMWFMKLAANYTRFHLHIRRAGGEARWALKGAAPRMLVAMAWPLGMLLYYRDIQQDSVRDANRGAASFQQPSDGVRHPVTKAGGSALFVLPSDGMGGSERLIKNLVSAVANARLFSAISVFVFCESKTNTRIVFDDIPNVTVIRANARTEVLGIPRFTEHVSGKRFDFVFAGHAHINALCCTLRRVGVLRTSRLVTRESTMIFERKFGFKGKIIPLLMWGYGVQDLIVCQTQRMLNSFNSHTGGRYKEKSVVLRNPINSVSIQNLAKSPAPQNFQSIPRDRVKIVWCGRMVDVKAPVRAVETLRLLHDNGFCQSHLVMIGDGPLLDDVKNSITELGVLDYVTLCGGLNNPVSVMARCDIGLLTSDMEGFPNVILEMLAAGARSVVTTDCAGDLYDLPGVLVAEAFSASALAKLVLEARDTPQPEEVAAYLSEHSPDAYLLNLLRLPGNHPQFSAACASL